MNLGDEANMYTYMSKELNIVVMNSPMDKEAAAEYLPSEEILVAAGYVFDPNRAKGGGGSHDRG